MAAQNPMFKRPPTAASAPKPQASLEKVASFADPQLRVIAQDLEKERQGVLAARNRFYMIILGAIGAVAGGIIFYPHSSLVAGLLRLLKEIGPQGIIIVGMIGGGLCYLPVYFKKKKYRQNYKSQLITRVVQLFGDQFQYSPEGSVSSSYFSLSQIFQENFNIYHGEDLVTGKIGGLDLEFSELYVAHRTGSGKNQHTHQVFKGIFFMCGIPRRMKGRTFILPDVAENSFGQVLGGFIQKHLGANLMDRGQLIKLENPNFEKYFVVYADDQVESRYLLSPKVMENLASYREQTGREIFISFKEDKVFVALKFSSQSSTYLEPPIDKPISGQDLMQAYQVMQTVIGLIRELNLLAPTMGVASKNGN
jgi:hypothetical protein